MSVYLVSLGLLAVVLATPTRPNAFSNRQLNIVGGNDSDISKYPWQTSLQIKDMIYCSAFFISTEWLLTSAYCIHYFREDEMGDLYVRAGSTDLKTGGQVIHLQQRIIHPDFIKYWFIHDIALIRLTTNVTDPAVRPAKLPEAGEDLPDGSTISISGWGAIGPDDSTTLQELQVPTLNTDECQKYFTPEIPEKTFCAGFVETGGKGVCIGDTGGAASIGDTAYGIITWDNQCGNINLPIVFTQLSKYRDWIRENSGI